MNAIRIAQHGDPTAMRLEYIANPSPSAGEIRIRHHAIGVNFIDTYHRTGLYKIALPSGLGQEAAGVVDAIGESVTRFAVGDRAAYCTGPLGAYAESNVVPAGRAVKLPHAISFHIAAASLL